jgi:hypothetical protein
MNYVREDQGRRRAFGVVFVALVVGVSFIAVMAPPAEAAQGSSVEKLTGSITIEHIGSKDGAVPGIATVELVAFPQSGDHPVRGSFDLNIYSASGELERTITAVVVDAAVSKKSNGTASAAFVGRVVADARADGGGHGGSDPGHDTGHDSGHEVSSMPGGESGSHGGGKDRVGQLIGFRVIDSGSPGSMDTVAWKWFSTDDMWVQDIPPIGELCPKKILGGNLVVHTAKAKAPKATKASINRR